MPDSSREMMGEQRQRTKKEHGCEHGRGTSSEATATERPLTIPRRLLDRAVAHLRHALPCEGCGLLAESCEDGAWRACAFFPGDNIDRSRHRFTMEPRAVVDALRTIDDRGWRLGAIVHSHPVGPATPSPTDIAEAYYPEAAMLIVGFEGDIPKFRAWRLSRATAGAVEVAVAIDDVVTAPASTGRDEL